MTAEGLARTLAVIGPKWTVEIMNVLLGGPCRFRALGAAVGGITPKMLTARLKELERRGVLARTIHLEILARVEYALTDTGRTLAPVIEAMVAWGETHGQAKPSRAPQRSCHHAHRRDRRADRRFPRHRRRLRARSSAPLIHPAPLAVVRLSGPLTRADGVPPLRADACAP